jgi:hypothetical protein
VIAAVLPRLERMHPMQLVLGGLLVADELATKNRQLSLAVLCEQAAEWATLSRDLFREIAADADRGEFVVDELLPDSATRRQIRGIFTEIKEEALTGRIL